MDSTSVALDKFPRGFSISVFDSWCMYPFCGALTSIFTTCLCVFVYFLLPIGILFLLYVLLLFLLDIKPSG